MLRPSFPTFCTASLPVGFLAVMAVALLAPAALAAGADPRPSPPAATNGAAKTPAANSTPATANAAAPSQKSSTADTRATASREPTPSASAPVNRPIPPQPTTQAKGDYILQPSDRLQIQVFQEDDLRQEVRISQEFSINLQLIGEVNLKGRTMREAQVLIRDLYDKDYLVNPQVTVTLLEYAKTYVNVIGSVGSAGPIPFPPEQGMTLMDAITKAGGFSRLADKKKVALTRTVDGKTDKTIINTEDILNGKAKDLSLLKDDVINVPESLL